MFFKLNIISDTSMGLSWSNFWVCWAHIIFENVLRGGLAPSGQTVGSLFIPHGWMGKWSEHTSNQGKLKGEVSQYHWPPVWLVWNQLYDNWQFLFLFVKQTNPDQSNRRSMVQWYFPFSIPCSNGFELLLALPSFLASRLLNHQFSDINNYLLAN